jgi:hypothetical protein
MADLLMARFDVYANPGARADHGGGGVPVSGVLTGGSE